MKKNISLNTNWCIQIYCWTSVLVILISCLILQLKKNTYLTEPYITCDGKITQLGTLKELGAFLVNSLRCLHLGTQYFQEELKKEDMWTENNNSKRSISYNTTVVLSYHLNKRCTKLHTHWHEWAVISLIKALIKP